MIRRQQRTNPRRWRIDRHLLLALLGNNSLGANDGAGYARNPVTGLPYASNVVKRGDFTRVLAEFWADGPTSKRHRSLERDC